MDRFLLSVTVVLVLVAAVPACALECYECLDTEENCKKSTLVGNPNRYLKTCPELADKCFRLWVKTKTTTIVRNGCTTTFDCEIQSKSICEQYDNLDNTECAFDCCDKNACNVGSPVSFSVFLLIMSSALGLALMM